MNATNQIATINRLGWVYDWNLDAQFGRGRGWKNDRWTGAYALRMTEAILYHATRLTRSHPMPETVEHSEESETPSMRETRDSLRLADAAPDLLAACEFALRYGDLLPEVAEKVREAIALAKGEK